MAASFAATAAWSGRRARGSRGRPRPSASSRGTPGRRRSPPRSVRRARAPVRDPSAGLVARALGELLLELLDGRGRPPVKTLLKTSPRPALPDPTPRKTKLLAKTMASRANAHFAWPRRRLKKSSSSSVFSALRRELRSAATGRAALPAPRFLFAAARAIERSPRRSVPPRLRASAVPSTRSRP